MIYLDHNATTPTRPEVIEAMAACWKAGHANPASQHQPGQKARRVLEQAREQIAAILGADPSNASADRLIFTSGGTEANNLAVLGIARAGKAAGWGASPSNAGHRWQAGAAPQPTGEELGQIVVSAIEHASVLGAAERLLDEGWRVDGLGVTSDGVVRVDALPALLSPHTRLVSVMLGNHETGVLQPVAELAATCNRQGVPLHTDAVQVAGKLPVHFRDLGVAAMSVAAHKFGGPLGIGALILRHGVSIDPLIFGGNQQAGIRPGTECVALAVGMATAIGLWQQEQEAQTRRLATLRERFESRLLAGYPELVVNGAGSRRLPQTSNVAFPGLSGQILLVALDIAGVACSVGSACASGSTELSPTLLAMGLPKSIVESSLRFSLGATTTEDEVDEAVRLVLHVVGELRS